MIMALLKEDGSLDVEYINNLPCEKYEEVMALMSDEQYKEYISAIPINESNEPICPTKSKYTLQEELNRGMIVLAKDFFNSKWWEIYKNEKAD